MGVKSFIISTRPVERLADDWYSPGGTSSFSTLSLSNVLGSRRLALLLSVFGADPLPSVTVGTLSSEGRSLLCFALLSSPRRLSQVAASRLHCYIVFPRVSETSWTANGEYSATQVPLTKRKHLQTVCSNHIVEDWLLNKRYILTQVG